MEQATRVPRIATAVLFFLCGSAQPLPARDDVARYVGFETNKSLRSWLVLAPVPISKDAKEPPDDAAQRAAFGRDFLASAGGETGTAPRAGQKVTIDGKDHEWRLFKSESDTVSFGSDASVPTFAVAYAWAEVEMPQARSGLLGLGSDDGVRVWLNGREVHANWVGRPVEQDAAVHSQGGTTFDAPRVE